jgi:hypothetical protein
LPAPTPKFRDVERTISEGFNKMRVLREERQEVFQRMAPASNRIDEAFSSWNNPGQISASQQS